MTWILHVCLGKYLIFILSYFIRLCLNCNYSLNFLRICLVHLFCRFKLCLFFWKKLSSIVLLKHFLFLVFFLYSDTTKKVHFRFLAKFSLILFNSSFLSHFFSSPFSSEFFHLFFLFFCFLIFKNLFIFGIL